MMSTNGGYTHAVFIRNHIDVEIHNLPERKKNILRIFVSAVATVLRFWRIHCRKICDIYICISLNGAKSRLFRELGWPFRFERNVLQLSDSPNEFMIKILSIAFYKTSIQFSLVLSFVLLVASWTKINGIEKKSLSCKESKWFFFLLWGAYESKNGNTNWSTHETMEKFIVEINYSIVLLVLESRVCNSNVLQYRLWILANGDTQQNMAFVHWLKGTKRIVYTSVYIQTTREGEGEREWASVWVSLYGK